VSGAVDLSLGQKQRLFARLLPRLLDRIYAAGFEVTLGEVFRSDEQAEINAIGQAGREEVARLVAAKFPALAEKLRNNGKADGVRMSIHQLKLAADINLFDGRGNYIADGEAHRPFGLWWKASHPLCAWGGDFRDGNHYSIEHGGVR